MHFIRTTVITSLLRSSRDINLLRTRFVTRAEGMQNCQTYQDRTCEMIFAGLETATDFELVRRFCMESNDVIYKIEMMLSGVRAVLAENLCKFPVFRKYCLWYFLKYTFT